MKHKVNSAGLIMVATLVAASLPACSTPPELRGLQQSAGDVAITAKVNAALDSDRVVKGSRINVSTQNGVVTLRGVAVSPDAKAEAINVARRVDGVRAVRDGVAVGRV